MKQKIYKLLSIVLTLSLVFTCCMVAFNVTAEETETDAEEVYFYVNPLTGDDTNNNGLSVDTPVATIVGAINKAIAYDAGSDGTADLGEGDTAYVKLIKATTVAEGETEATEVNHQWYSDSVTSIPKHSFKLDISSYSDRASIDMVAFTLKNDTKFTNVYFCFQSNKWPTTKFDSHNVSFGPNVGSNTTSFIQFGALASGKQPDELNYSFESFPFGFYVGCNYGSYPVCKNINITLDNGVAGNFFLGDRGDIQALRLVTFDGNLNFNIKNAKSLSVKDAKTNTPLAFTSNFAAQFINSTGTTTITDSAVAYFSGKTVKDTTDPVKYFVINNSYGVDAIEFTETAGKYKVNLDASKYTNIRLVNDDESVVAPIDNEGCITVTEPGEYTLRASGIYYVSPNGDNSAAGSLEYPLQSINGAIAAAGKAGHKAGDIVYIKVVYVEGASALVNTESDNVISTHEFTLDISSASSQKASIGVIEKDLTLGGDLLLNNINLNIGKSNGGPMLAVFNNNFYIGKDVTQTGSFDFAMRNATSKKFSKDFTIYMGTYFTDLFQST